MVTLRKRRTYIFDFLEIGEGSSPTRPFTKKEFLSYQSGLTHHIHDEHCFYLAGPPRIVSSNVIVALGVLGSLVARLRTPSTV